MSINIYDDGPSIEQTVPPPSPPDAETLSEDPDSIQVCEVPVVTGRFWKGVLFALLPSLILWGLIIWVVVLLL